MEETNLRNVVDSIHQKYSVNLEIDAHSTALRLLEYILDSLAPTMEAELTTEWFNAAIRLLKARRNNLLNEWLSSQFRNPLRDYIRNRIYPQNHTTVVDLRTKIYRLIVSYILSNNTFLTPWDVINRLSNPDGTSMFKSVTFSARTVPCEFVVYGQHIAAVYDLNLDEFMGILATVLMIENYEVTIYGITSPIASFSPRLTEYEQITNPLYTLETRVQSPNGGPVTFVFNNLKFLAGFTLPFTWINDDHHKYWTNFYETVNGKQETRTF